MDHQLQPSAGIIDPKINTFLMIAVPLYTLSHGHGLKSMVSFPHEEKNFNFKVQVNMDIYPRLKAITQLFK